MASKRVPAQRRLHGNRRKRPNRRVMTAGAAASLMLTVAPGLVVAPTASASQSPAGTNRSHINPVHQGAATAYRARLRTASAARISALNSANATFSALVAPHRVALSRAVSTAPSRAPAQAARVRYGQDILAAKTAHRAAMESARTVYVETVEQARIDFLVARGAAGDTIRHAKYRQAVNSATAEYQAAIVAARDTHRTTSANARAASGSTVAVADGPPVPVGQPKADRSRELHRNATQDVTGVFRSQLGSARHVYQAKLALAKGQLRSSAAH